MNRRSIFTLSAITVLGLTFGPGSAIAQQKSLKEQLVGIWTALSAETTGPNGAKQQFYGAPAKGILILDARRDVGFNPVSDRSPLGDDRLLTPPPPPSRA